MVSQIGTTNSCLGCKSRDTPLLDSSGYSHISEDGNLAILDESRNYWPSKLEGPTTKNRIVRLLNFGNLVLTDDNGHLWDSFKLPPDTLLPRMTLEKKTLISWRNDNNPETGNFVFEEAGSEYRKIYRIWNQTQIYWESGEILTKPLLYLLNSGKISSLFRSLYYPSLDDYRNIRLLMNSSGEIQLFKWDREFQWVKIWWKLYDYATSMIIVVVSPHAIYITGTNVSVYQDLVLGWVMVMENYLRDVLENLNVQPPTMTCSST